MSPEDQDVERPDVSNQWVMTPVNVHETSGEIKTAETTKEAGSAVSRPAR
jgi:hypothetical protein